MLVFKTLKNNKSDFLISNTCQCSRLYGNSNSVHYLIQIHAHNCQHLNLSPKQYLHYNITQQTKTEIFQVSYKAVLVEIGTTSRLFRFLSTKIGFFFYLSSWQLYNHVKFVKKVKFSNILLQIWLGMNSLQIK